MRYVNKFDFIVENVAQARAILNRNRITYDNPIYQDILKNTKRDGYTGFVTKMVFDLGVDKDDAIEIYYKVKKTVTDAGELNKMSKEEVEKILVHDEEDLGYKYLFTEDHYKVFKVDTYEGIMKISSPAWCLKTKSFWDDYTKTRKGMQFVVIQERFVPRDAILLTTPSDWDGARYESGSYAKMRFGVTVYPSGRMDIFDDSNIQLTFNRGSLSNDRYNFIKPILDKITEYHKENVVTTKVDWEEYDQMKDTVIDIMDGLNYDTSFSNLAPVKSANLDDDMNEFYEKIKHESGLNKNEFLKSMNQFREKILSDDDFISKNGYMDILVNEFLTANGEESLPNVSNITTRNHPLGGYFFDEQEIGDSVVKYGYGYQYTKYGKAGIEQGFGSVKSFYEAITNDFAKIMLEQQYVTFDIFYSRDIDNIDGGEIKFIESLSDCMTKEEYKDGYKIIIDIPKLLRLVKRLNIGRSESYGRNSIEFTNTESLAEKIKEELSPTFKVNIDSDNNDIEIPSVSILICSLR